MYCIILEIRQHSKFFLHLRLFYFWDYTYMVFVDFFHMKIQIIIFFLWPEYLLVL